MAEHKVNPFAKGTGVILPEQLCDALGRALKEGDQLILSLPKPSLFTVEKIAPVFDPNGPANLMDITVRCRLKFRAVRDEHIPEFLRVLTAEELPQEPK